jgi:hypothetical protein
MRIKTDNSRILHEIGVKAMVNTTKELIND